MYTCDYELILLKIAIRDTIQRKQRKNFKN